MSREVQGPCQHCNKHKATMKWLGKGSMLDYAHGNYEFWCGCCATQAQLTYARKRARKIAVLERELKRQRKLCARTQEPGA